MPDQLATVVAEKTQHTPQLRTGTVIEILVDRVRVAIADGEIEASYAASASPAVGDVVTLLLQDDQWLLLDRVIGPGGGTKAAGVNLLDGAIVSAGTAVAASTGAEVDAPGYEVEFIHPANHSVLLFCKLFWSGSTAADWIQARIRETTTGTYVGQHVEAYNSSGLGQTFVMLGIATPDLAGGAEENQTRRYVVSVTRLVGAGTVQNANSAGHLGCLLAFDLGDTVMARVV